MSNLSCYLFIIHVLWQSKHNSRRTLHTLPPLNLSWVLGAEQSLQEHLQTAQNTKELFRPHLTTPQPRGHQQCSFVGFFFSSSSCSIQTNIEGEKLLSVYNTTVFTHQAALQPNANEHLCIDQERHGAYSNLTSSLFPFVAIIFIHVKLQDLGVFKNVNFN